MATRFALADGSNTWARPIDETPDDIGDGDLGTIIAAGSGRVYVYGADERMVGEDTSLTRYTVQALDAETGRVIWKTATGDGDEATEPNRDQGYSISIPEGVVAVYGAKGRQYALLDADDGKVRWKRPLPDPDAQMCLLRSAARTAYLVCQKWTGETITDTSLAQLDPATGRPRWTVTVKGAHDIAGQADGRLVVLNTSGAHRTLTLVNAASHIVTTVRLSETQPQTATPALLNGRLYFTLPSGNVRAFSPDSGRRLWASDSTVESAGPPTASATRLYLASPSGRLAALNLRTGRVEATLQGRDDGGSSGSTIGAPLVLVGDALYVPYGIRSVYTVDVRDL
jgi:outer membrane protein assembly factor BamB